MYRMERISQTLLTVFAGCLFIGIASMVSAAGSSPSASSTSFPEISMGISLAVVELSAGVAGFILVVLLAAFALSGFLLWRQYRLNRRLKEQTRQIEDLRDEAEQAKRAKDEFLTRMSHDIRTPLNSIVGMTELLEKTALDRAQEDYVQTCRQASETLLNLINDVLDLSRVETGELELERTRIDLEPLILDIVSYFARKAHQQGIELPVYIDPDCPAVLADQNRLQQILVNLISNAIKFTDEGEIVVRALPSDTGAAGRIRFEVEDTGVGIPDDQQEHIFDRFHQAVPETSPEYSGTGLGLSICKHLVEQMDGDIGVNSEEGTGSTFWFELPLKQASRSDTDVETGDPSHDETVGVDISGHRVLIAENSETNRFILQTLFEELGAIVSTASDGYRALEEVNRATEQDNPFDLLLIDRDLSEMDGFELGKELEEHVPLDRVVVMLKSNNLSTDRDRARQMGFGDYLVKPISRSVLLESLKRLNGDHIESPGEEPSDEAMADWQTMDAPPRILIAEDNEHNRKLMEAILQQYPVRLDFAENGQKAFKMAKSGLFDLIFMDVRMPEMSGLEATRKIRAWEEENQMQPTPVIALTAQALEKNRRESREAGCDEHITKPVRENLLVNAIRKYMTPEDAPEQGPDSPDTESTDQPASSDQDTPAEETGEQEFTVRVDERFKEFVPDFLDDLRDKCSTIREQLDRDQMDDIADLAHDMKGAGGSFGFDELRKLSKSVEEMAENHNPDQIAELLDQIEHRLDHLSISYD